MKKSNKLKSATVARKRERRSRRATAKRTASSRSRVSNSFASKSSEPPDTFGLSAAFRNNINWAPPKNRAAVDAEPEDKVCMMIRHAPDPCPWLDNRLVAVNSKTYKRKPLEYQQGLQGLFWQSVVDRIRPVPIDFIKSGSTIFKSLDIAAPDDMMQSLLALRQIDEATDHAAQSALFSAFNTSAAPADLETVMIALATFVHTHPAFKDVIEDGVFHQPFGENTAWTLLREFDYDSPPK